MRYNFLPYNQDQQFLLPPDLQEWVEEDSRERFLSDVVDHLQAEGRLAPFCEGYREDGWGHPAYHPVLMVEEQFEEGLALCREAGLAELGRVALDGRRVQGEAALARTRTREQIRQKIEEIVEEAERVDAEDEEYGSGAPDGASRGRWCSCGRFASSEGFAPRRGIMTDERSPSDESDIPVTAGRPDVPIRLVGTDHITLIGSNEADRGIFRSIYTRAHGPGPELLLDEPFSGLDEDLTARPDTAPGTLGRGAALVECVRSLPSFRPPE